MPAERKVTLLKRAVIKEEYIVLTGDMTEAVILNQMIYWSERVHDFDRFIKEEQDRQAASHEKVSEMPLLCGWIHKSADELKSEIMSMDSSRTINRKLDDLVEKGYLDRRRNPNSRYDHKYQYRVNFVNLVNALQREGYSLEGYRVEFKPAEKENIPELTPQLAPREEPIKTKRQIVKSNEQFDESIRHNVTSESQDVESDGHGVGTIPESIIETIIETTSPSILQGEDRHKKKTKEAKSLNILLDAIGIDHMQHADMSKQIRDILTNLWFTRKIGRTIISADVIRETLQFLTPELLDGVIDTFARQTKTQVIYDPTEYLKAAILKAPQNATLLSNARNTGLSESSRQVSYDIDEYARLSMERLIEER